MKLAIGYSTKDQVDLTKQTLPRLIETGAPIYWCDGSKTEEGRLLPHKYHLGARRVLGGPDAAIAWKLSKLLCETDAKYICLAENDVLLDEGWLEPTMELFERGKRDGLTVGAASPRSYVDRVLIQRDGYAVMHNIGAGIIIFTREAARIALRTFRTGWWADNVNLFAQISGIDLRSYAFLRGNDHAVTTDWQFEAQLARHGLASLALTPARCDMIGQFPSLKDQGLELTTDPAPVSREAETAFEYYRINLARLRDSHRIERPGLIQREGAGMLVFPHQLGNLTGMAWRGTLGLKWIQGYGPFAYRAGPGGASLTVRVSGSCAFLVSGGEDGAQVTIEDTRSGFKTAPTLPAGYEPIAMHVPGTPIPRLITMDMAEGATFHALSTSDPQMLDSSFGFDWNQLPEAM